MGDQMSFLFNRLGLHLTEIAAAKAYDRVAIKKWGPEEAATKINFPLDQYNLAELDAMDMAELVTMVRGEYQTSLNYDSLRSNIVQKSKRHLSIPFY